MEANTKVNVGVRIDVEVRKMLEQKAAASGKTLCNYVRDILVNEVNGVKPIVAPIEPIKVEPPKPVGLSNLDKPEPKPRSSLIDEKALCSEALSLWKGGVFPNFQQAWQYTLSRHTPHTQSK